MQDRNTITTTTVRLPALRAEQLRAIAAAHGRTLTEQVEAWIHAEIAAGVIGPDLPGIDLWVAIEEGEASARTIKVSISGGPTVEELLAGKDPAALAGVVERAQAGAHETIQKWREAIAAVSRRGTGFVVVSPVTGEEMVMSQSILADLKAQVERAAAA